MVTSPETRRGSGILSQGIRLLVILALLAASLWFALRDVEWGPVRDSIGRANLFWIIGAALTLMLAHLARAVRWRFIIPDGKRIGLFNAFSATVIGYFLNNIIPRSGELGRPYALARREGESTSELMATVVVERILDSLTLLVILAGILFLAGDELVRLLQGIDQLRGATTTDLFVRLGLPVIFLLLFLILLLTTRLGESLVSLLARLLPARIGTKIASMFEEFRRGARLSGKPSTIVAILFWTVIIWLGYGLSLYCGILAFGFNQTYGLGVGDAVVLLGITAIGTAIAPTPGGFGVFHSFCRAALVSLYQVPAAEAVAFAFLTHFAQYGAVMLTGPLFALREGVGLRSIRRESGSEGKNEEKRSGPSGSEVPGREDDRRQV